MTADLVLELAVTAVAVAVSVLYVPDLAARHSLRTRLNAGLHLVMGAAMAVMVWPLGMAVPPTVGACVFSVAAALYAYQIAVPARAPSTSGLESHQHRGALLWYHLAMMVAMGWMYVAMGLSMTPKPGLPAMAMPVGMPMPPPAARPAAAEPMAASMASSRSLTEWPALVSWACLLLFLVALLAFAGLLLGSFTGTGRDQTASERRRVAASLGMAAVMAVGFGMLVLPQA